MERNIEIVCRLRVVQFETTSSEILLKKRVSLALVPSIHNVRSKRRTGPHHQLLHAVHYEFPNRNKSSRSVLGRERSLSNTGTMRFLQRVFTSRVRVLKNHNILPLSSWLTTLPPGLEPMCQPLHAQPPLANSETCSMECPLKYRTTSTYCSPNGSGYRTSYLQ